MRFYFARWVPSCHADRISSVVQQLHQYGDTRTAQRALLAPAYWDVTACFRQMSESSSSTTLLAARIRFQLWNSQCLLAGERPFAMHSRSTVLSKSWLSAVNQSCVSCASTSRRNLNSKMAVFEKENVSRIMYKNLTDKRYERTKKTRTRKWLDLTFTLET